MKVDISIITDNVLITGGKYIFSLISHKMSIKEIKIGSVYWQMFPICQFQWLLCSVSVNDDDCLPDGFQWTWKTFICFW